MIFTTFKWFLRNIFSPPELTFDESIIKINFHGNKHYINIPEIEKLSIRKLRFGFYTLTIWDGNGNHELEGLRKCLMTRIALSFAVYEIGAIADRRNKKSILRLLAILILALEGKNAMPPVDLIEGLDKLNYFNSISVIPPVISKTKTARENISGRQILIPLRS